jgi:predicted transposase YbfD/YdcC
MSRVSGQLRRALRHAVLEWSSEVVDPRQARGRRHAHQGLLGLLVAAFACGFKSLRRVEDLAVDLGARVRKQLGLPAAVSDSTLWRLLAAQGTKGLRETVASQVKRLLKQPGLESVALPLGVMTFDGKSLWTSLQREVPGVEAVACDEKGTPLQRLGALRAVLTSRVAAPCVDLEFIGAKEGESPAFRQLLPRVVQSFGEYFQVVTGDAGLAAAENAALVRQLGKHYLLGLKENQPTLYAHAVEAIAAKRCAPRARTEDRAHGEVVVRELWTHALAPGEVEFPGARLLLCVRQTHLKDDGTSSVEWRYFVTSLCTVDLGFHHLLRLVRLHWAIENRHNWTLDMVLEEDDRQPCLTSRTALEVTAWLRVLAYNLLSAWRAALPLKDRLPVAWARACELLRDALVHGQKEVSLPTLA